MGIFLRQSYNVKPLRWGSPADIEYAIKVNAEKVYDVDPDSIVLAMPLFWGLPCLDYSGHRNDGVNHGAYYKDGELEFDGVGDYIDCGTSILTTGVTTVSLQVNKTDTAMDALASFKIGFNAKTIFYWGGTIVSQGAMFGFRDEHEIYSPANSLTINVWQKIDFIYDGNDADLVTSYKIYIDKVNQSITRAVGEIGGPASLNRIGKENVGAFNGLINEVRICSVVLSTDQIALFHALPYGLYQPVIRRYYSIPIHYSIHNFDAKPIAFNFDAKPIAFNFDAKPIAFNFDARPI